MIQFAAAVTSWFQERLRNLRVASRQDINRLTRALGRTEDKLEQVLQEVERLRDDLDADASANMNARVSASVRLASPCMPRVARRST